MNDGPATTECVQCASPNVERAEVPVGRHSTVVVVCQDCRHAELRGRAAR